MLPPDYHYPAFFYFDPDGISFEFPDLPGYFPCAHSEDEAFHNAREVLGLHLYGIQQDGDGSACILSNFVVYCKCGENVLSLFHRLTARISLYGFEG